MELPLASAKHQWKIATVAMVIGTYLVVGMVLASNCGSKLCPSRMHARPNACPLARYNPGYLVL